MARARFEQLFAWGFAVWFLGRIPVACAAGAHTKSSKAMAHGRRATSAVCFSDGTAKNAQKLSMLYGNLSSLYTLEESDLFGISVAALGDVDGDGVVDLAVGAYGDDDGGPGVGAVYVVFLDSDGIAKNAKKLSMLYGGFS
jgi:hypothetical protein